MGCYCHPLPIHLRNDDNNILHKKCIFCDFLAGIELVEGSFTVTVFVFFAIARGVKWSDPLTMIYTSGRYLKPLKKPSTEKTK